jgi:hypothetical protein
MTACCTASWLPRSRTSPITTPRCKRCLIPATTQCPKPAASNRAKQRQGIQSIEVGTRLLRALAANGRAMMLRDIARNAGMPAAKAHRYLVSFMRMGLVEQDANTGRYDLGEFALELGLASLARLDPVRLAGPVLDDLCERSRRNGGARHVGQSRRDLCALGRSRRSGHHHPAHRRRAAADFVGDRSGLRRFLPLAVSQKKLDAEVQATAEARKAQPGGARGAHGATRRDPPPRHFARFG